MVILHDFGGRKSPAIPPYKLIVTPRIALCNAPLRTYFPTSTTTDRAPTR